MIANQHKEGGGGERLLALQFRQESQCWDGEHLAKKIELHFTLWTQGGVTGASAYGEAELQIAGCQAENLERRAKGSRWKTVKGQGGETTHVASLENRAFAKGP